MEIRLDGIVKAIGNESSHLSTHSSISIATSSTSVLSSNPVRRFSLFVNFSPYIIYLFEGSPATNLGIPLYPKGGYYEINQNNLYTGIITAIASGGTGTLQVMEA